VRSHFVTAAILSGCGLALTGVLAADAAQADPPASSGSFGEAAAIIANARKILTPQGVERLEAVRIGGIEQWVSIRGRDTRNPVLLVSPRKLETRRHDCHRLSSSSRR
jgi:proline iminopeptidase